MTEPHVKFDVPAILCKWPSLNNARRNDGTGPYMVAEGTLAACIREFMAKPGTTRHLYEIHTAPQALYYRPRMSLNSHGCKIFSDPARRGLAAFAIQHDAMTAAAKSSLKDHDRWPTARKLDGRPSIFRLLALRDYVLTRHTGSRPCRTQPRRARQQDPHGVGHRQTHVFQNRCGRFLYVCIDAGLDEGIRSHSDLLRSPLT
jgi:hypothetical protein